MAPTTIQISQDLLKVLRARKLYDNESYEDIIWNMLEDTMELSEQTKRNIAKAQAEIKAGKYYTLEQVKEKLGYNNILNNTSDFSTRKN